MPTQDLGSVISTAFAVPEGVATIFERGLTLKNPVGEIVVSFALPMIGRPTIATGAGASALVLEPRAITFRIGGWQMAQVVKALTAAFDGHIALVPTGGGTPVPLTLGAPVQVKPASAGVQSLQGVGATAALAERTLYDVAVRAADGNWKAIAPHAVYYRSAWHDFGIAHATDIHVARRIDWFTERLEAAGKSDAARRMVNWNDRFRGFIKYANYLHAQGLLDVILATGDIIDYQYEDDDPATNPGGNAQFMRDLLTAKIASRYVPEVEELRVPIFMVPGNHDYRRYPYYLRCDLTWADLKQINNYSGFRLSGDDALTAVGMNGVPSVSADNASKMLVVEPDLPGYKKYLADETNYMVRLGSHRVAMLDSGPDTGLPTSTEALSNWLNDKGLPAPDVKEDATTAIDGSPNSVGVTVDGMKTLVDELADPAATGLFIVGLHAPLFNPWNEEYPYYLRETQRTQQATQVYMWLIRQTFLMPVELLRAKHPEWFGSDNPDAVAYMKRGSPDDLLDFGVSRGGAHDVLKVVTGIGQRRPVDVVLHGHIHRFCDFRLSNVNGDVSYSMDFYTQNLAHYYPARFASDGIKSSVTYVDVVPDAPANSQPSHLPHRDDKFIVTIPPYAHPLSEAQDPKSWWNAHRPLVLQTEALGPFKGGEANLGGFRLMTVKNDVIQRIDFVSIETLHAHNYRIDWKDAIKPDQPRPYQHVSRSREFNVPGQGNPCGYTLPNRTQNILYRNGANEIMELWRDGAGNRGCGSVSGVISAPKAKADPSCYFDSTTGNIIVPYWGVDGHVHTLYWSTGNVGHDGLSQSVNAPQADGRPFGFYNKSNQGNLVVYRTHDGHLHSLSWAGAASAVHEDLTGGANAVTAAGNPAPYLDSKRNTNIVVYRGTDRHIRSIYWSEGPSGLDDLSGVAQAPLAEGDPVAYYMESNDTHQVVYRGVDGHLHELYWTGVAPVARMDLTARAGAPKAASDATAWYNAAVNLKHVVYRGVDNHLYDIRWTPGADPVVVDLSMEALAAPAWGVPFGFNGPTHQHVVYRGTDGEIHEIRWPEAHALFDGLVAANLLEFAVLQPEQPAQPQPTILFAQPALHFSVTGTPVVTPPVTPANPQDPDN